MSSIFDIDRNKEKCQKFTPPEIVETMLNLIDYTHDLTGKRIMENSFGSGNILKAIVKRYIEDAIAHQIPHKVIVKNLENDIYGIELDKTLYLDCINKLNHITDEFGLPFVKWSLFNDNALTWNCNICFDYVIGNPPYIAYKDIDIDSKTLIKQKFSTCGAGKFDYCYAFIEMGINLLNDTGKMVQLIPSNVYKNVFAESLRKLLSPNLSVVLEYPTQKMFGETLTSSSIFLFDKLCTTEFIKYKNVTKNFTANISRQLLVGKWVFEKQTPLKNKVIRFGDCFHASIAVATLLNKAFVICKNSIDENPIEATLLRNAAAPKAMRYNREEYIIFPYYYEGMELKRYSSEKFEKMFPLATKHLKKYKTKLEKRNKDKKAKWFEYGRSQALAHLNQEKLLLSTVITNKVELYTLDSKTIPYSGIYITKKNSQYTLETAIEILQSQQFLEYVKRIGISVSGESMRITCKDINNFCFEVDKYGTAEICN